MDPLTTFIKKAQAEKREKRKLKQILNRSARENGELHDIITWKEFPCQAIADEIALIPESVEPFEGPDGKFYMNMRKNGKVSAELVIGNKRMIEIAAEEAKKLVLARIEAAKKDKEITQLKPTTLGE